MESNTNTQLKVGIFLTVGILFILGSIFFLGADKAVFTTYVRVHAHFTQVQGLSSGSLVSLSGVTVGNVERITFLPEKNSLDVTLKIDKTFIDRVREGSQVEIRTQGALGDKYVFITPGDPRGPSIKDGDILEVAKGSDIIEIISERGSEAGKVFDIINELQKITLAINADNRLARIMSHMENASTNLSQTSEATQRFMVQMNNHATGDKLGKSIEKLDAILTKIDRGEGTLGALINDPSLHNQLKSMLGASSRKSHVKSLLRTSIEQESKD